MDEVSMRSASGTTPAAEMAERLCTHDWAATFLGPLDRWAGAAENHCRPDAGDPDARGDPLGG